MTLCGAANFVTTLFNLGGTLIQSMRIHHMRVLYVVGGKRD